MSLSSSSAACDFCSGWIAGMAGLVVGHPIDTLKVRQQILGKGMLGSVSNIYRAGGMLTFFRGMGAPLLTNGAMNSVFFSFYGSSLDFLLDWRQRRMNSDHNTKSSRWAIDTKHADNDHPKHIVPTNCRMNVETYWDYCIAGCIGGAAQLVIACPVDLVKVQLQSQIQKGAVKGPVECMIRIVKTNGIFGLYKGFSVQALRDIPASGLYFVIYEFWKKQLSLGREQSTKFAQFFAGGIAGTVSWWSILPLDVIKSRIQGDSSKAQKYTGIFHCASLILKADGVTGLFRGFWPLSLRAFPVNGTTFIVYEYLFQHCKQYHTSIYS